MQSDAPRRKFLPVTVFLITFGIYLACASVEVGWGDSAKYALLSAEPEVSVRAGYHIGYSYTTALLVRLIPFGSYASKVNQINALYAAVALMLLFKVLRRAVKRDDAALVATLVVALSHPIFLQATIAESYPFFWMVIALFIVAAAKWRETRRTLWLLLGALIAGFGVCVNLSTFFLLPAAIVFLVLTVSKDRPDEWKQLWKPISAAVGFFIIGMLPLIVSAVIVFIRDVNSGSPGSIDLNTMFREMTDIKYAGPFFLTAPGAAVKGIAVFCGLTCYAFPVLAGILVIIGLVDQLRRDRTAAISILVAVCVPVVLFSTYMKQRLVFIYSIPLFLMTFWVAHGARRLFERFPSKRTVVVSFAAMIATPIVVYGIVHACSPKINSLLKSSLKIRNIPHRDNAEYFLVPWRFQGTGTKKFAEEIFALADGGIVYSDFTPYAPLEYLKTYHGMGATVKIKMKEERITPGEAYKYGILYGSSVWFLARHIAPGEMDYMEVVRAPDPKRGPYWRIDYSPEN
ncbi:MAG: DUF2723 domain-containing protein [Planctomycetota bacterium]|nr:MAG: DUF2723 domain-containing protein [Planctomycetota bacterium]